MGSANPTPVMTLSAAATKSIKINAVFAHKVSTSSDISATSALHSKPTMSTLNLADVPSATKESTETAL